jgi:hypothetical protein
MMPTGIYPRKLRAKEEDLLIFVLPPDRIGYRIYHEKISRLSVLSPGRRGPGNFVLGIPGMSVDLETPLMPVIAYGVVESTQDELIITVREEAAGLIDVELVSRSGEEVPDRFEEKRRWTYSTWEPGNASPATGTALREIRIGINAVMAISQEESRIWVFDRVSGMNHLIPITSFYGELMLQRKIRDPRIALHPRLLFNDLHTYRDEDIALAFTAYNKLHHKVEISRPEPKRAKPGLKDRLKNMLRK